MPARNLACRFLPAEKDPRADVLRQHERAAAALLLRAVMDAMPVMVLLLNRRRQIVCANRRAQEKLGGPVERLLGLRFGEAAGCVGAGEAAGCGTGERCALCGAADAMREALDGGASSRECRIRTLDPERCLDLRVWARPFALDALNMVGAVRGLAELLPGASPEQARAFSADIARSVQQLVAEIVSQRDLSAAESGGLIVEVEACRIRSVVDALVGVYRAHDAARGRALVVDPASGDATVATSRVLLTRVAGNMIKNALEAERRGATVVVGCGPAPGGGAALWVRNPTPMPREVQLQVFQRSFSTKDPARGLGAYSMKLLTERYLGGTVSFSSDAERGTEFRVVLPAAAPPPSRPKS
jgi:hypothetical protein